MNCINDNDISYFNKLKKNFENKIIKKVNILSGKYIKKIIKNIFILNGRSLISMSKKNNTVCFKIDDLKVFSEVSSISNWSTLKTEYSRVCIDFKDGSKLYLNDKEDNGTFEIEKKYGL
tara:strand:+ start:4516 stop:4872 length:357 start_codon:yes stop_codon:yes gene_type:complete